MTTSSSMPHVQARAAARPVGEADQHDTRAFSISVVIPTYNDAERLPDAIQAVVAQTYKPVEIIVSDDASSDRTEEVVSSLALQHPEVPIRYSRLPQQNGVVAARNNGIRLAQGEWIANCDSDDIWVPTKLERQTTFLERWDGAPISLLGSYGVNINDRRRVISNAVMGPTSEAQYRAIQDNAGIFYVIHSSVMFRKATFRDVGGYTTEYGAADDFHFFTRMADHGVLVVVPEPLVYYRKRIGSIQFARFADQRAGLERLVENRRRQRFNLLPVDASALAAAKARAPRSARLRDRRRVAGMYHYRVGAARLVNGQILRGAFALILASCLDTGRVRAGVTGAVEQAVRRVQL